MDKFTSIEKAIARFQRVAKASYIVHFAESESRKPGVSPHMARSHPHAKRSRPRCLFPNDTGKLGIRISQEIDTISRVIIIIGHSTQTIASVVSSYPLVDVFKTGIIIIPSVTCKRNTLI